MLYENFLVKVTNICILLKIKLKNKEQANLTFKFL